MKSEKVDLPAKLKNVSFSKSHPEYENNQQEICLSRKRFYFYPGSPHDTDVSFCQKDWERLAKAKKLAKPV